ncbi:MAG: murein L,D-transpeptidase catalytic domain family protein [Dysgonamonadaceae bacterium]|jgi:uncharacterized protein YxeA|nr:murein L,D-transpeptidase catalytic domain family protein [Dysgonamonadaceae bacterium]
MKKIIIILSVFTAIAISCGQVTQKQETNAQDSIVANNQEIAKEDNTRTDEKAKEALTFCEAKGYNTDFCVLIDMEIHSGKYRMFIYDFNSQKIERKALCAHGCGKGEKQSSGAQPIFSNQEGSLLTSLGKYKIGARSYSQYGINVHYKLHGLETSNSNAFKRIVVLHSHTPVPSVEIHPAHLPMGWSFGCPVTDNETMTYLDTKLKNTKKSVLLWIYY